jgi:7-carboxy-7-deazaguanine synthase
MCKCNPGIKTPFCGKGDCVPELETERECQINSPHYTQMNQTVEVWKSAHGDKIPVTEIFHSIEGEGIKAGLPSTFVRFVGCNLRCNYCDTKYSFMPDHNTEWMSLTDIMSSILNLKCKNVTFTGGEPLLYQFDIAKIAAKLPNYRFNIETNGTIEPTTALWQLPNVFFTADCKCPSSGSPALKYAKKLRPIDALKFVVGTSKDLEFVKEFLLENNICTNHIFIHPVFDSIELETIANFVKENEELNVRMGIQLHKLIWNVNQRGV